MWNAKLSELGEKVLAVQLHDVNVHWLELEMDAGAYSMRTAYVLGLASEDGDVQLQ